MVQVSIIMPLYNKKQYVEKVINAIIDQTYQDWELIVVNDGSSDGSEKIVQQMNQKDDRIKLINQENKGVSEARNKALQFAKGKWIWFVDADDIPQKDFLKNALEERLDDVEIIVGSFDRYYENQEIQHIKIEEKAICEGIDISTLFMKYQYKNGYWGYLWNKLIRKELILNGNIEFEKNLKLAEDLKFMIQLYRLDPRVKIVSCCAMRYTVDAYNSSKEEKIDYYAQMHIQMMVYDWIIREKEQMVFENHLKRIISNYAGCIIFHAYESGEDYKQKALKLMRETKTMDLLITDGIDKIMKPIVKGLKEENLRKIEIYLNGRSLIRKLYRKIKS